MDQGLRHRAEEPVSMLSRLIWTGLGGGAGVALSLVLALGAEIFGESLHYHDAGHGGAFPTIAFLTVLVLGPILGILGGVRGYRMGKSLNP